MRTMILTFPCSLPVSPSQKSSKNSHNYRLISLAGSSKLHRIRNDDSLRTIDTGIHTKRRCNCLDLSKQLIPYKKAWDWQKTIVRERYSMIERDEDHSDTVILLQHPPVYTLGTGSNDKYLNFDINNSPYEIYRTERGGEVTYHGPGQLVMYPIMNLRYHKMDLHWYLRSLEELIIRSLSNTFSIEASRLEGFTGVWVGKEKIAAIGIRVSRWVTYHGLALNILTDLNPFKQIVPCGIRDKGVTSLKRLLSGTVSDAVGIDGVNDDDDRLLMDLACKSLAREFAVVFRLDLDYKSVSDLHPEENYLI